MTSPEWVRVRTLFEEALEVGADQRGTWLHAHEADDRVRAEVLSLLASHDTAGAFLDAPLTIGVESGGEPIDPGTRVGPYEVVREIGRGGMGRVYLAIDTRLGRQVALKALPAAPAGEAAHARFRREAQAAAALMHPGLCAVHALEELPEGLFIVTEYIDGETLRAIIARGERPSPAAALDVARQLADAVAAAHARGLVHGDLKPENVMRTRDGRMKILDFGLARFEAMPEDGAPGDGPVGGATFGTPAYMAPEQIDGARGDSRADVFALGVLLHEFASGVHPFAGRSALATVGRIVSADVPPIETIAPSVPPVLASVIARSLQKNPAARFASAGEMVAQLAESVSSASATGHVSRADAARRRSSAARGWWRIHQLGQIALDSAAVATAWRFKEWEPGPAALWIFVALSAATAAGGMIRGHWLFVERWHPERIAHDRTRTIRAVLALDLFTAGVLAVDALASVPRHPVPAALALGLGVALALAAILIEPSTTAAAFD